MSIAVLFSNRRIHVNADAFLNWFPVSLTGWINGEDEVDKLKDELDSTYNISRVAIERTLYKLFGHFKFRYYPIEGETRLRVARDLSLLARRDLFTPVIPDGGLYHARHSFVILAYLAYRTDSVLLAGALMDFWYQWGQDIAQVEQHEYNHEWEHAIQKIQHLGPDGMVRGPHMGVGAVATLPYPRWNRGRSPRLLGAPWPDNRARSAPVTRRRRSPDYRIGLPVLPSSAWTTPMVSPVGFPQGHYFDGVETLQWQQEEMNAKLNNIGQKVDLLVYRDM